MSILMSKNMNLSNFIYKNHKLKTNEYFKKLLTFHIIFTVFKNNTNTSFINQIIYKNI